ncbi:MAG: beta-galactosidase [Lentisphaeria bacterium]|nr:beta-galactosidase [Lentisphaeria bacterium]
MMMKMIGIAVLAVFAWCCFAGDFYEVKKDRGVPRIFKNGKVMPSRIFFGSFAHIKFPHAREVVPREFSYAKKVAGVDIFEGHGDLLWSDGDLEKIKAFNKERMDRFFKANPEGFLLVRLVVNPPGWWYKKHPDGLTKWADGRPGRFPNLASETYQKEVNEALRRTIRFYEETYPGRMIGYHPAGLRTSEWLYDEHYTTDSEGYDRTTVLGFRKFLKEKYRTDDALKKAWNDPDVTFNTAAVPTHEERKGDGIYFLKEPAKDAKLIDFYTFRTELISSTICRMAKTIKTEQPGRLTCFFYGYTSLASWYGGGGKTGYLAFRNVLNSPDVDIFCSPFSYNWRRRNQPLTNQGITDSIAAAGKLWLNEDDTVTHLGYTCSDGGPATLSPCYTPQETADMLRRNLLFTYMKNHAIWWMDLNGAGWFDEEEMWLTMKEFIPLEKELLNEPVAFEPELAIALDQRGALHFIGEHAKEGAPPNFAVDHIGYYASAGAPYGVYLQDDVLAGKTKSRLTLFLSCYALDAAQRRQMREYSAKNSCIWLWAPGWIDLESGRASVENVETATGFKVKLLPHETSLAVKTTPQGRAIGLPAEMGPRLRYGVPTVSKVMPILSPIPQKGDLVLGVYENGEPAVILRKVNGIPQVFCGTTVVPVELFRYAAKLNGVHFYTDIGPAVYSNGRDVGVYATADGTVKVTPKVPGTYVDYFSRKRYSGKVFDIPMKQGNSVLLLPEKVNNNIKR